MMQSRHSRTCESWNSQPRPPQTQTFPHFHTSPPSPLSPGKRKKILIYARSPEEGRGMSGWPLVERARGGEGKLLVDKLSEEEEDRRSWRLTHQGLKLFLSYTCCEEKQKGRIFKVCVFRNCLICKFSVSASSPFHLLPSSPVI